MSNYVTAKRLIKDYLLSVESNKIKVYTLILFGVIISSISILEPFFMKEIIDLVELYIKDGTLNIDLLIKIFIYWGLFIIFILFVKGIYIYSIDSICLKSYNRIYNEISSKFLYTSYGQHLGKKSGETFKIFDKGMEYGYFFVESLFTQFFESIIGLFVIIIILMFIDYRMALITLIMVPFMIFIGFFVSKKTIKKQIYVDSIRNEAYGDFGDALNNLPLVKTLTLENKISNSLKNKLYRAYSEQINITKRWVFSNIYTGFLVMISRFLVLSFGIYFLINDEISFAVLFLFFSYIGYIYFPISNILNSLKVIQKQLTGAYKLYEQYDELILDDDNKNDKLINLKIDNGDIEFKNVSFGYLQDKGILNNVNFKINGGKKIAFVGNTGAGKSTIVNLLFRFWDINGGSIFIDGINLNNISKKSLRNNIGIVMQDNSLFNMSIRENLSFAKDGVTEKEIISALKNAEANFVFDMEKGLDTVIGERGLKLSGGEKQRLNIARLFLKNPKILVLDEATSALDNKTELLIQKALDKLMEGRTTIVIAHRLSTIQNADNIYLLKHGKIIEEGNYNYLMNKRGSFYDLAKPDNLILQ